jgi:hypothetical protein
MLFNEEALVNDDEEEDEGEGKEGEFMFALLFC